MMRNWKHYGVIFGIVAVAAQSSLAAGPATLTLSFDKTCYKPADAVTATLSMSALGSPAAGFQAFLAYDTSRLSWVSTIYSPAPFGLALLSGTPSGNHIDVASGIDQGNGQAPTSANAVLVTFRFTMLGPDNCSVGSTLVFRDTGPDPPNPQTRVVDGSGNSLLPLTKNDAPAIAVDSTNPSITCPPNVNVFADAGGCSAIVSLGSPMVSDNCDGSPSVGAIRSDSQPLNAPYPQGVTNVTWTATDACGNSAACGQTVTVQPKNLVAATIELKGVVLTSALSRCIRFVPRNGASCGASVAVNVSFSGGVSGGPWAQGQVTIANADLQIACGVWTSLCAKDEQHTLSDSSVLNDLGATYQAATTLVLRGGDTDNDNDVDINDVTLLLAQFGSAASPNSCPWNGSRDADFSNNGVISTEDYTFLSDNWQQFASCCGATGWPNAAPHDGHHFEHVAAAVNTSGPISLKPVNSIAVSQVPEGWRADLNGDGMIDVEDVKLFERAHGLNGALSQAMQRRLSHAATADAPD